LTDQLSNKAVNSKAWKSFVAGVITATDDLDKNEEKLDAGDPEYQTIDIAEARNNGIMPIAFEAASR
jgi:hypothetical protein